MRCSDGDDSLLSYRHRSTGRKYPAKVGQLAILIVANNLLNSLSYFFLFDSRQIEAVKGHLLLVPGKVPCQALPYVFPRGSIYC